LLRRAQILADRGDAAIRDRDTTLEGRSAQAVDDARVVDDEIMRVGKPPCRVSGFELRERGSA